MLRGFILGLSSGGICLMYCIPVLIPYLLGEGKKTKENFIYLCKFMLGRLSGYILFAILAWITGNLIIKETAYREILFAVAYILLSLSLIIYVFTSSHKICNVKYFGKALKNIQETKKWLAIPLMGFLTGINLCPPFLLAFSDAALSGSMINSILYFISFFIGTSIYFIPVPFVGVLKSKQTQIIGLMVSAIIALYYMYTGIIMLIGGITIL